jgi:LPXTG-motif cell wall-anchored protein
LPYGESTLRAQQTVGTIHVPATASVTVTVPVASPRVVKPEDGDTATTGTPTFSGKGVSGAEVALVITCDDGFMLDGSTKVNPYGKWSVTPNDELPKGTCTITAAQGINSVTSAETDPIPFTVDILSVANPNHQELQRNDRDTASEDDEDDLPDTGLPSMNLLTLVSGVFLLGLGSAMYVRSRRWASGRL